MLNFFFLSVLFFLKKAEIFVLNKQSIQNINIDFKKK